MGVQGLGIWSWWLGHWWVVGGRLNLELPRMFKNMNLKF